MSSVRPSSSLVCFAKLACLAAWALLVGCAADPCKDDPKACAGGGQVPAADCGGRCGGACGPCADGMACAAAADCASGVCGGGLCQAPSCADGVKNGAEIDTDCGGACGPCALGRACTAPADCVSGACQASRCVSVSCTDGMKNGAETDTDCGGACGPCALGRTCAAPADCQGGLCAAGRCAAQPALLSVAPASGPTTGGLALTITGQGFVDGPQLAVRVGAAQASAPRVLSATQLSATLPEQLGTRGVVDVVVTNGNGLQASAPRAFTYFYGVVDFAAPASEDLDHTPTGLSLIDVNDDGRLDLVTGEWGGDEDYLPTQLVTRLGRGDGTFEAPLVSDLGGALAPVSPGFPAADLDSNGTIDLIVPSSYDNVVGVLAGAGDGSFVVQSVLSLSGSPTAAVVADFNEDGRPDVALSEWDAFGGFVGLEILLLGGGGDVLSSSQLGVGAHPAHVAVADLNGDGHLDLIASDEDGGQALVLLGHGDGGFDGEAAYAVDAGPQHALAQDVSGDGKPDLVVSASGASRLSVLIGNGDGTFQATRSFDAGAGTRFAAAADLDGDGRTDLAAASGGALSLSVLLGKGGGDFQPAAEIKTGFLSSALYAADLDGDRMPELVLFNQLSRKASVLRNRCR